MHSSHRGDGGAPPAGTQRPPHKPESVPQRVPSASTRQAGAGSSSSDSPFSGRFQGPQLQTPVDTPEKKTRGPNRTGLRSGPRKKPPDKEVLGVGAQSQRPTRQFNTQAPPSPGERGPPQRRGSGLPEASVSRGPRPAGGSAPAPRRPLHSCSS